MKVAIAVGHSVEAPGAVNRTTGLSEFVFNSSVAAALKLVLPSRYEVKLFFRPHNDIRRLVVAVNDFRPNLALELHANGFTKQVSGAEALYWHTNKDAKHLAEFAAQEFALALGIPYRGAKAVKEHERGWYFLANTRANISLITEPFFITTDKDLRLALINFNKLVSAYVSVINFAATLLGYG